MLLDWPSVALASELDVSQDRLAELTICMARIAMRTAPRCQAHLHCSSSDIGCGGAENSRRTNSDATALSIPIVLIHRFLKFHFGFGVDQLAAASRRWGETNDEPARAGTHPTAVTRHSLQSSSD